MLSSLCAWRVLTNGQITSVGRGTVQVSRKPHQDMKSPGVRMKHGYYTGSFHSLKGDNILVNSWNDETTFHWSKN